MSKEKNIDLNEEKSYKINVSPKNLRWWGGILVALVVSLITATLWINNLNNKVESLDKLIEEFEDYKDKSAKENEEINKRIEKYINIISGNPGENDDLKDLSCEELNERILYLLSMKTQKECQ